MPKGRLGSIPKWSQCWTKEGKLGERWEDQEADQDANQEADQEADQEANQEADQEYDDYGRFHYC